MTPGLSPREGQILELVAEGLTSKAIAARLGIGESTVNWHLANALRKLGASSRAAAVAIAMRDGVLSAAPASAPPPPSFANERRRWQVLLAMSAAAVLATPVLIAAAMFGRSVGPQDLVPVTPTLAPATPAPSAAVPVPASSPTAPPPAPTSTPAGVGEAPLPVLATPVLPAPVLSTPALATPTLAPVLPEIRLPLPTPRLP